ncbi:hypothetical protein AO269_31485 [Pseudomonas putida]|nr:hypothetical protein AO269_31485 [Pseudomonas putida]
MTDVGLQLGSAGSGVGSSGSEDAFEFGVFGVLGEILETSLTIFRCLDEVVEYLDRFFMSVGHFKISVMDGLAQTQEAAMAYAWYVRCD